jgi:hypothetical protein
LTGPKALASATDVTDDTTPTQRQASPPALVLRLALEQPVVAYLDALNDGEEARLRDHLAHRPGLIEALQTLGVDLVMAA